MQTIMEDLNEENLMLDHAALAKRIKRSLYYDPIKDPEKDTLSFSVTKFAVEGFRNAAPSPIKKLGHRYAARVARDACVSPCSLLLGVIYIERLKNRNPEYLQQISSSDLFLISMMVASKYLYDEGVDEEVFNDEWASSGGLTVPEVNRLEMEFLSAVDWRIYVHPKEFNQVLANAEASIARLNGLSRGWMTYSDLRSMLDCYDVYKQVTIATSYLYRFTGMCLLAYSGFLVATTISAYVLANLTHQDLTTTSAKVIKHEIRNRIQPMTSNSDQLTEEEESDLENEVSKECTEIIECLNKREMETTNNNSVKNDFVKVLGFINKFVAMWTVASAKPGFRKNDEIEKITNRNCKIKSNKIPNTQVIQSDSTHSIMPKKIICHNCKTQKKIIHNRYQATQNSTNQYQIIHSHNLCFKSDPLHGKMKSLSLVCHVPMFNISTKHLVVK